MFTWTTKAGNMKDWYIAEDEWIIDLNSLEAVGIDIDAGKHHLIGYTGNGSSYVLCHCETEEEAHNKLMDLYRHMIGDI